jgi:hypothetical protein
MSEGRMLSRVRLQRTSATPVALATGVDHRLRKPSATPWTRQPQAANALRPFRVVRFGDKERRRHWPPESAIILGEPVRRVRQSPKDLPLRYDLSSYFSLPTSYFSLLFPFVYFVFNKIWMPLLNN